MDLILIMPSPNEEMWPLNSRPIALYNFLGKPLIEHVIEKIRKNDAIKNIFLLYPERFEDYMKKLSSSSQILKLPKNIKFFIKTNLITKQIKTHQIIVSAEISI